MSSPSSPSSTAQQPPLLWPAALCLHERIELEAYEPSNDLSRIEKAKRRLQRWQAQNPFDDPELRQQRFASPQQGSISGSSTDEAWLAWLSTPEQLSLPAPEWARRLSRIYGKSTPQPKLGVEGLEKNGFNALFQRLLHDAGQRFDDAVQNLSDVSSAVDVDAIRSSWLKLLIHRLRRHTMPTLVLELRIASLEERLEGETPEERFTDFVASLADAETATDLLRLYPVLARQWIRDVDSCLEICLELMARTAKFHSALERRFLTDDGFSGDQGFSTGAGFSGDHGFSTDQGATGQGAKGLGRLCRLSDSGGDPHRGGRIVFIADFESGKRLVYKPRPLAVEAAFQDLLTWAGTQLDDIPRPTLFLDCGDHGWMEWLEPAPCRSEDEIRTFYRRLGGLLAFLHLLGATDMHLENLMAVSDQPLILDLETLLHPQQPSSFEADPFEKDQGSEDGVAISTLEDTVLRVGLLPIRMRTSRDERDGLDPSGMGAEVGQKTPGNNLRLAGPGTDEMAFVPTESRIRSTPGRPVLNGEAADPIEFADSFLQGFASARAELARRRQELLDPKGPLAPFQGLRTRVVLRATRIYAQLLRAGFHPHMLGDAVDRDRHFDRLWLSLRTKPWLRPMLDAEHRDLWRGDIPYFSTLSDSTRCFDAEGHAVGYMRESGWAGLQRRLGELNPTSTDRQLTLIRQTFELRAAERGQRPRPYSTTESEPAPQVSGSELLDAAFAAADRLADRALIDAAGARWLVPLRLGQNRWTLVEAGPDLYYGLSGIALFLARLFQIGGRSADGELAEATLATLKRQLTLPDDWLQDLGMRHIGAYNGWGSVIYSLTQLAEIYQRPALLQLAEQLTQPVADLLEADTKLDLVHGTAGAALALCQLHRSNPGHSGSRTARLIERCGNKLLESIEPQTEGVGWPPPEGASGPLAGLSHGASGLAWALTELATIDDLPQDQRSRLAEAAGEALRYEGSLFDAVAGNWRDLRARPEHESERHLVAWCHGAPGIGLARIALLQILRRAQSSDARVLDLEDHLSEKDLQQDVERAVTCTLRQGFGLTHSLCHGDLGNLDFLLEAASEQSQLQPQISRLAAGVLQSFRNQGFLYGSPGGTEPAGLMVGTAGIGYGFLRLAAADRTPSLLRLAEQPCQPKPSQASISRPGQCRPESLPTPGCETPEPDRLESP